MSNVNVVPISGVVVESSGANLLARLVSGGVAVTQASITAITYNIYDLSSATPDAVLSSGSIVKTTAIFDSYQTSAPWTKGGVGFNFWWKTPAALFPEGGISYLAEVFFDMVTAEDFTVPFKVRTVGVKSN